MMTLEFDPLPRRSVSEKISSYISSESHNLLLRNVKFLCRSAPIGMSFCYKTVYDTYEMKRIIYVAEKERNSWVVSVLIYDSSLFQFCYNISRMIEEFVKIVEMDSPKIQHIEMASQILERVEQDIDDEML